MSVIKDVLVLDIREKIRRSLSRHISHVGRGLTIRKKRDSAIGDCGVRHQCVKGDVVHCANGHDGDVIHSSGLRPQCCADIHVASWANAGLDDRARIV